MTHPFSRRAYIAIAICVLLGVVFLFSPGRFATFNYDTISRSDIEKELLVVPSSGNMCPIIPPGIESKPWEVSSMGTEVNDDISLAIELNVDPGGMWQPSKCTSQHKVTLVIPYRNRPWQLDTFLDYIHHFLQEQMIAYRIIVVEQSFTSPFNRGKLLNVGFVVGEKWSPHPCYIFHDVDLIPENLLNIYSCTKQPRHMCPNLDTFRYNLMYNGLFGGAVSMTSQQFRSVNGYSNVYYGWGGEDDDFKYRLDSKGYKVVRFPSNVARYTMLPHTKAEPNSDRFNHLYLSSERFDVDGLSDLNYTVISTELRPLYTWINVHL